MSDNDLGPFDTRRILGEQAAGAQRVVEIRKVLQENRSPKLEDATWLSRALDVMEARLLAVEAELARFKDVETWSVRALASEWLPPHEADALKADAQRLTAEVARLRECAANDIRIRKATEEEVLRLREALNHGFCRKCGESVAPHGGSDPEHRWPY